MGMLDTLLARLPFSEAHRSLVQLAEERRIVGDKLVGELAHVSDELRNARDERDGFEYLNEQLDAAIDRMRYDLASKDRAITAALAHIAALKAASDTVTGVVGVLPDAPVKKAVKVKKPVKKLVKRARVSRRK